MILARVDGPWAICATSGPAISVPRMYLRTGNKKAAVLTLLFDAGKGAAIVLLARSMASEDAAQLAGLAAFLGHCFPVWLKFKGGKGVATYFGIVFALSPFCGLDRWRNLVGSCRY